MSLPADPFILASYINTKLRDEFDSLDELCKSLCIDKNNLIETLKSINYEYDNEKNCFC